MAHLKRIVFTLAVCITTGALAFCGAAHAATETPEAWLRGFVDAHATPAPRCAKPGACTDVEDAARREVDEVRSAAVGAALDVALEPGEAPLYSTEGGRATTALELLAIATHETGLQPRLWHGVCRPRECDGGRATGELQLHLGPYGVQLVGDKWVRPCTGLGLGGDHGCLGPKDVLEDHAAAFRIALHILRGGGLPGYTGQPASGPAPTWVRNVMAEWLAGHPAPAMSDVD